MNELAVIDLPMPQANPIRRVRDFATDQSRWRCTACPFGGAEIIDQEFNTRKCAVWRQKRDGTCILQDYGYDSETLSDPDGWQEMTSAMYANLFNNIMASTRMAIACGHPKVFQFLKLQMDFGKSTLGFIKSIDKIGTMRKKAKDDAVDEVETQMDYIEAAEDNPELQKAFIARFGPQLGLDTTKLLESLGERTPQGNGKAEEAAASSETSKMP